MAWLYPFAIVWTAVASSAITTIVLKRRAHASKTDPYPVPTWVPPADELRHRLPVPMPAAAAAVTIRFVVPEEVPAESWDRDETKPRMVFASASSRLPTVPA